MRGDRKKIRAGELKSRQEGEKKKATNYLIARAISFWLKKQQHFA